MITNPALALWSAASVSRREEADSEFELK
jgi:hypothetical protein